MMKPWEESECLSAKRYGKLVPRSGAGPFEKLDIEGRVTSSGDYSGLFGENKATEKFSFSLNIKLIKKGIRQALMMGGKPFWIIDFLTNSRRLIICTEEYWVQVHSELKELKGGNHIDNL